MARIELERWATFWPDALPLFREHHEELGSAGRFAPDAVLAARLDAAGALSIMTAREDGALVGYCIWYLTMNIESAGAWVASQGPWFVTLAARHGPLGLRLFLRSTEELRRLGIREAFPHRWVTSDEGLDKFFSRIGATPLEIVYSLKLG